MKMNGARAALLPLAVVLQLLIFFRYQSCYDAGSDAARPLQSRGNAEPPATRPPTPKPAEVTPASHGEETGQRSGETAYTGPNRVYCMVPFVWVDSHKEKVPNKPGASGPVRYNEIMETWGKRCDKIEFFVDGGTAAPVIADLPDNVIQVNMTRGIHHKYAATPGGKQREGKHIWEKMWRSWIWVGQHRQHDYEWFFKLDDDCFFIPENVKRFVREKRWSPLDAHYFGHKAYHRREAELIVGAAVGFSRTALLWAGRMYRDMPKGYDHDERGLCEDRSGATEELSTAICMKKAGILPEPARDALDRELVMPFKPEAQLMTMPRPRIGDTHEGWFWKGKPAHLSSLSECCSLQLYAAHGYKRTGELRHMFSFFYEGTGKESLTRGTAQLHAEGHPVPKYGFSEYLDDARAELQAYIAEEQGQRSP